MGNILISECLCKKSFELLRKHFTLFDWKLKSKTVIINK